MPNRSFSDITQKDWLRACRKLDLIVNTKYGKGSHCLITNSQTNQKYTVQHKLHKFVNLKIFKKLMEWGFSEKDIWNALN